MTLREERVLFSKLLCELVLWCFEQGWQVALDEGTVKSPRRMRNFNAGANLVLEDGVHRRGSFHYSGRALDLLLYDDLDGDGQGDDYVANGDDPRWKAIATKWESMHPKCSSGRRWRDANHVSFGESDRSEPLPD